LASTAPASACCHHRIVGTPEYAHNFVADGFDDALKALDHAAQRRQAFTTTRAALSPVCVEFGYFRRYQRTVLPGSEFDASCYLIVQTPAIIPHGGISLM
jgi:hypothetical protein